MVASDIAAQAELQTQLSHDRQAVTIGAAVTTFAITSDYVQLTCTAAENIATITGGLEGTRLIIEYVDTNCTLDADATPTATDALALDASDVSAVNKVIMLVYNGSHWLKVAESDNT